MAYTFDPINNTLIDDEDKSLGNKLALNQDEFQKLLEIPGVFKASEAPQPPQRPDVQEIEAINRFMRDNPVEKAEGGRINFDKGGDTSPVYNEKTGHIYKKGNRFGVFYSKTPPKNQFTAIRPLRSLEELQKVINEAPLIEIKGKFFEQNPEDLMGDSEYNTRELISRKELDQKGPDGVRYRDKLKFKSKGKKRIEEVNQGNINRRNKIIAFQGSEIPIRGGKQINKAFSHVYPIIGSAKPGTKTTTVIDADMNSKLLGYNIIGQKIAEDQEYLLKVKPEGYKKQIVINNAKAKKNVMDAIQDLGKKYKGQIGYFQVDPETGVFKPKMGNYKMSFAGIEGENKIYKDMTSKERTAFSKKISNIEKLKTIPGVTTADKILPKIFKGAKLVGKVIKPVGYVIGPYAVASATAKADEMGIELSLMDKIKAFDSGDADVAIDSWKRRNDPEYAAAERAKDLAQMTDDFEEVGLDEIKPDETIQEFMAHGGRVGLKNGGAAGADVNFATELEYLLTNPDVDLPEIQTYTETKNPIQIFNDIINPKNYPYYADVLARSGIRIGEFGIRLIPAAGKLISDAIQKGPFRIKESKNSGYAQDFGKILLADFEGTGIFSEFLKNITPTSLEKKVGLDKIIKKEEQRLKDTGSTVGPKVFADTLGLGAEVSAPVFPGLKIAQKTLTTKKVTDLPEIPKPLKSSEKIEDLDSIENLESNIAKIKILNEVEPLDPATKITRLLAEKILTKKGIKIGDKDPIDVYVDVYGEIITDVKSLAEEIIEADLQGRSLKSLDELLEIEGLLDVPIPKEPFKGIPVNDTIQMLEKEVREKKILDSFSTKGKTKNAKGGIIK